MALSPLTAQLPGQAGALPDLFRRTDAASARPGDTGIGADAPGVRSDAGRDDPRALSAGTSDDTTRLLARHAALGPLTYGRRMVPFNAPASVPVGMRGAHLDVRG